MKIEGRAQVGAIVPGDPNQPNVTPQSEEKKKKRKALYLFGGIFILVTVVTLGQTFAGQITVNVNSGGKVEFGQGISAATACDLDMTLTPEADYYNGSFYLSSITISNLAVKETSTAGYGPGHDCVGKTFKLYVIDSTTAGSKLTWAGTAPTDTVIKFTIPYRGTTLLNVSPVGSDLSLTYTGDNSENGQVVLTSSANHLSALSVDRLIIQTQ